MCRIALSIVSCALSVDQHAVAQVAIQVTIQSVMLHVQLNESHVMGTSQSRNQTETKNQDATTDLSITDALTARAVSQPTWIAFAAQFDNDYVQLEHPAVEACGMSGYSSVGQVA